MQPGGPQPRTLAFDEGPFSFDDPTVPVAGVMTRGARVVEGLVLGEVTVDGWDATETVVALARRLPGAGPDQILIDGITLGGLNLVDLASVARLLGRPVFGVTRRQPDRAAMERAVAQAPDPERRRVALPREPPAEIRIGPVVLHVQAAAPPGMVLTEAFIRDRLRPTLAEAGLPEPLRLAHHVATAVVRGVSGTKA